VSYRRAQVRSLGRWHLLRGGHQRLQLWVQDGLPRELASPASAHRARVPAHHGFADACAHGNTDDRAHARPDAAPVPPGRLPRMRRDCRHVHRNRHDHIHVQLPSWL
jgi:hypothetical protein